MLIDRNLLPYIVFSEDAIIEALRKISRNVGRVVFAVSERGLLEGVLTNGDFRRWLAANPDFDVNRPVARIMNRTFRSMPADAEPDAIVAAMGSHTCIPLTDARGHLVAFARQTLPTDVIKIGQRSIGFDSPAFIIAEIGNNHNGSLELALKLIDLAAEAGADCAKFQLRDLATLYRSAGAGAEDLGAEYTRSLLDRFQLKPEELYRCFDRCREHGLAPLCTPWDLRSVELLEQYGIDGYKVASADLTNPDLLRAIAATGKPMFCSTGMSSEDEIIAAASELQSHSHQVVLLHCNSTYPAPYKDINLSYLNRLKEIGRGPVGYSGHERGINVAVAAVALGAKVIEKHFTIDRDMEGSDHKVSLLPEEFATMVQAIRQIEASMGAAKARTITQGEMMNRSNLAKSLIASRNIAAGDIIEDASVVVQSPGRGLQPNRKPELVGRRAIRSIKRGDFFYPCDVGEQVESARPYQMLRPWGVPARYHDLATLRPKSNLTLIEFHHSFKDLDLNVAECLKEPLLFARDHVLDLTSPDAAYRERSVGELQRVIDLTRTTRHFFPACTLPRIIVNLGGFSLNAPLSAAETTERVDLLGRSLKELDTAGVALLPQTMPPFPWHFGGQRYHNLMLGGSQIVELCERFGFKICLDLSHSALACRHAGEDFTAFLTQVAPYASHLHVADARGLDGEGLQVGEGDIDFESIGRLLDRLCPTASFIPEVWQGHINDGEGFWKAMARLEKAWGAADTLHRTAA
jgi:N-acetylneuraminate synthase